MFSYITVIQSTFDFGNNWQFHELLRKLWKNRTWGIPVLLIYKNLVTVGLVVVRRLLLLLRRQND